MAPLTNSMTIGFAEAFCVFLSDKKVTPIVENN